MKNTDVDTRKFTQLDRGELNKRYDYSLTWNESQQLSSSLHLQSFVLPPWDPYRQLNA